MSFKTLSLQQDGGVRRGNAGDHLHHGEKTGRAADQAAGDVLKRRHRESPPG